jgi:hypothetical protein
MEMSDLTKKLRELADEIDESNKPINIPEQITFSEALSRIRAVSGNHFCHVQLTVGIHGSGQMAVTAQAYSQAPGGDMVNGSSLSEAVENLLKVMAKHNEPEPTKEAVLAMADATI